MDMGRRGLAVVLAAWSLVTSCAPFGGEPTPSQASSATGEHGDLTPQELIDGQRRWQEHGPDSYTMTVGVGCFCAGAGTWTVEVDGESVSGELSERVFEESYGDDQPPTIDGLYRQAISLIDPEGDYLTHGPSEVTITGSIDDQGLPWKMHVNLQDWFDEEITWSIESYRPADSGG